MKLRNLFLASLAVCTMASCSKDDDGISGPQEVDAYLSFASTTDVMTKASTEGDDDAGNGKEAKIQSLTAYVFDEAGKYVISKHVSLNGSGTVGEDYNVTGEGENQSITSIKAIHVKVAKPTTEGGNSSTTFKVVLLANTEHYNDVTKLVDLEGKTTKDIRSLNAVGVGKSYLPMHSPELTVGGLKPSSDTEHFINWYNGTSSCTPEKVTAKDDHTGSIPAAGATKVIMTRSIARVQLVSLKADFSALESDGKTIRFDVTSVFLANVRANASVMGEENTGAGFYRGAPESFDEHQFLIALNSTVDEALVATYSDRSLTTAGNALTGWDFDKYINANSPESIMGIPFTANGDGSYSKEEGGAYQTRLIIAGNYYDGNQSKGTRYFHIPLKLVGDAGNVASNKFFKVSATITGEGSPNPDEILENACINFSIEVAPWNVVEQTEDDTN